MLVLYIADRKGKKLMDNIYSKLIPDALIHGSIFPELVKIISVVPVGDSVKLICEGMNSGKVHQPILSREQLEQLEIIPVDKKVFDGDANKFRLGIEATRLALAYEYDPYFTLSIARVDPLPHQLEAVYDYFLKLPRIRFLLADDPGAGKTIMAGLLIKELKIRGLIKRTLIVTPANLCFQWQREPHPEDPQTAVEVRFIEVKGRSYVDEVSLTANEYKTALRLKKDFWLYVVYNCASSPGIHIVNDPAKLGWKPIIKVEHYQVGADSILRGEEKE
ncbi:MAG: DUF3883 domain-containing protein [Spirochaetales bacterium]|nr:DUF3883 domain-containing protein [Spirochaetales bacterium]